MSETKLKKKWEQQIMEAIDEWPSADIYKVVHNLNLTPLELSQPLSDGTTLLERASDIHGSLCFDFMDLGADPNVVCADGQSPMSKMIDNIYEVKWSWVDYFLQFGACPNLGSPSAAQNAAYLTSGEDDFPFYAILESFLQSGNVDIHKTEGWQSIHDHAMGKKAIRSLLEKYGYQVSAICDGATKLQETKKRGISEVGAKQFRKKRKKRR